MSETKRVGSVYDDLTFDSYKTSGELCAKMAERCDSVILAFSCGKDSIAAWLQLKKYFKHIYPYYCYLAPELEFVDNTLAYYEEFFETNIMRIPHPSFYRFLRDGVFQPPYRANRAVNTVIPDTANYDEHTCIVVVRNAYGLSDDVFCATGVRMADSPLRRISTMKNGAISFTKETFMPVYDWLKADLLREFDKSGVLLPPDYRIWGRTFDGLDYRFVKPLKEHFPRDYEKLVEWYPFVELEIARRDGFDTIMHNDRKGIFE